MRVVNDRRRLPRVAWSGHAVIQTRRGEVRGVGLDLSADGMAVVAPVSGKARDRVRIHTQLGEFPLLTDARVVRMTKTKDGYRWALRFERLDDRMRANLEAFVRQQLAHAARVRQAQLYASRLKGGALPPPPTPAPQQPAIPTPAPQQAVVPTPAPQQPLVPTPVPMPSGGTVAPESAPASPPSAGTAKTMLLDPPSDASARPQRPDPTMLLDPPQPAVTGATMPGTAPEPGAVPVHEIELPPADPVGHTVPSLDLGPGAPAGPSLDPGSADPVYTPYNAAEQDDERALLGEGVLTPDPTRDPRSPPEPVAPEPVAPAPAAPVAKTLTPHVIEIDDNEDLSLADILSEAESSVGGRTNTPVSDLQLPDAPKTPAPSQGLDDVPVLDDGLGEEEETRRRGASAVAVLAEAVRPKAPVSADPPQAEPPPSLDADLGAEDQGAPALVGSPVDLGGTEDLGAPALVGSPVDLGGTEDLGAPALVGSPVDLGGTEDLGAPALVGSPVDVGPTEDLGAPALVGSPVDVGPTEDLGAPALVGSPVDVGPAEDLGAPALVGSPVDVGPAEDLGAPALVGSPVDLGGTEDLGAPALVGSPVDLGGNEGAGAPALVGSPVDAGPAEDLGAPALVGSPVDLGGTEDLGAPALVGSPVNVTNEPEPTDDAPALVGSPLDVTEEPPEVAPALAGAPFEAPSARPTLPPATTTSTDIAGAPFVDEGPEVPSSELSLGALAPEASGPAEQAPPTPSATPTPPPETPSSREDAAADADVPPPPNRSLATPPPVLYADDAPPFDPYEPNSQPPAGSASPRLGSAPRALGELPPVVEGLYTPTSNPRLDEPSGAYESATFQPFPSAEEGLYGGREDVSFEEQQGNPRQRLAHLQQDDRSTHKLADQHDLFLGDIEGVTTGLTPTPVKMALTDEDLSPPPSPEDDEAMRADAPTSVQGVPELTEMEPTRPVDVGGPAEYTPAPIDTPAPQELGLGDIEFDEFEEVEGIEELEEYEDYEEYVEAEAEAEAAAVVEEAPPPSAAAPPTYPEFNVIPDFNQPLPQDSSPSGPEPAQSGRTIVASPEELGLLRPPPSDDVPAVPSPPPGDFSVLPSFGGGGGQPAAGFTVVASFEPAEHGPGDMGGGTMIASAEDVEAWRAAGIENPVQSFDDERTGTYTPAPGSLPPLAPQSPGAPFGQGIGDDALTAMRVGRGAQPEGGAGFELNPRGPAPAAPAEEIPMDDTAVVSPGPSPRRSTTLDTSGRPAPPPKPQARAAQPQPKPAVVPELRGSGSVAPAAPSSRRSLVEDALADLKRKTEAKRKERGEPEAPEKPPAPKAPSKQARRQKRLGKAEQADPAIAELYKAAMTDLDGSRE